LSWLSCLAEHLGVDQTVIYKLYKGELRCSKKNLKAMASKIRCLEKDLYCDEFRAAPPAKRVKLLQSKVKTKSALHPNS
jgi:hypothetical protein